MGTAILFLAIPDIINLRPAYETLCRSTHTSLSHFGRGARGAWRRSSNDSDYRGDRDGG